MKNRKLLRHIIGPSPRAGTGVHTWLFNAARRLKNVCPDENEQIAVITEAVEGCGRDVAYDEIAEAVRNSRPKQNGEKFKSKNPKWPSPNRELIQKITGGGPSLVDLEARSPVKWLDDQPHTEEIVDALFVGNPLICAGPRKESALTRTREEWRGFMANQQFIVPSPMSSVKGVTTSGRESMRSNANTGPRRFLVVEFDHGSPDEQATLLLHLAEAAPLALVVHSGNKSLHGWFYCGNQKGEIIERFFKYAVSLGADPATWTRCQLVRMPYGWRDTGVRQRVLFFNPKTLEAA